MTITQRRSYWTQAAVALAAVIASVAAAFAALKARNGVSVAAQGIEQQNVENQLSTAVSALGGSTTAERVAGLTLLQQNVIDQLSQATGAQSRHDADGLYTNALGILASYIRSGGKLATGSPCPAVGLDVVDAADEIKTLLGDGAANAGVRHSGPAIDLSSTELCYQYWVGARFDWLSSAYLYKIDLRGANLQDSRWGITNLTDADLQCANLYGANLSQANLTGARLRGANVTGTRFPKGLAGSQLDGTTRLSSAGWDPASCLKDLG